MFVCRLFAVCLLLLCMSASADGVTPEAASVRGLVKPSREVTLHAPLEGRLASMEVEEGERVEAGRLLAGMDEALQEAQVEAARLRAQSDVAQRTAAAGVAYARMEYELAQEMVDQAAGSPFEVRRARLALDQAELEEEAAGEQAELAEAELELERRRLERHRLRAPFPGVVVRTLVEPGATLTPNDPVVRVADLATLHAELYAPMTLWGRLEVGRTYRMHSDAMGVGDVTARLMTIDPVPDPASRTFRLVFEIGNAANRLPGSFEACLADLEPLKDESPPSTTPPAERAGDAP